MKPDPYAFEERAAIREFDAGFGRAKAEWLARQDVACALTNQDGPAPSLTGKRLPGVRQVDPPP